MIEPSLLWLNYKNLSKESKDWGGPGKPNT